jgi:hypothetical protein
MNKTTLVVLIMAWAGGNPLLAADVTDFSEPRWRFRAATVRVETKLGRPSLFVQRGYAYLTDPGFADGSVQVDVAVPRQRNFAGVVFRVASEGNQEEVYLRPHKSGLDDALQYQPTFDASSTWQLYSAPRYMRAAEIPKEQWLRLKIVFAGREARVFLDSAEPVLVVPDLKRGVAAGGIGVWAGPAGAWFSNLSYEPAPAGAPPAAPPAEPYPAGLVTSWELSPAFDAVGPLPEEVPSLERWERVGVEPPGMLVIDRHRKSTGSLPPAFDFEKRLGKPEGRRIVYARAVVDSEREQAKRLSFGYSDECVVFLNGRVQFTGRSAFRFRDPGFMGIMDVENDALYLPLRKGRNELVMAVAEYFGGWGLVARFDDPSGLTFR